MENKQDPNNISQLVNQELTETIEIAKQVTVSLDLQNKQLQSADQQLDEIEHLSQRADKKVKMMNSVFYRWWIWLKEIGVSLSQSVGIERHVSLGETSIGNQPKKENLEHEESSRWE